MTGLGGLGVSGQYAMLGAVERSIAAWKPFVAVRSSVDFEVRGR